MNNSDQPTGSQGTYLDLHRAFCDLILDADEAEIDRIIVAFHQDPPQLAAEGRRTADATLADPKTKIIPLPGSPSPPDQAGQRGFSRLVQMLRRREELSIAELARQADVSEEELQCIEAQPAHLPKPRTLFQLERFFELAPDSLGRLSGVIVDTGTRDTADATLVRFAACAEGMGKLTREEKGLLAQFVDLLARRR